MPGVSLLSWSSSDKSALRARARSSRALAGEAERREAAARIASFGIAFAAPEPGAVISAYYPVRGEIDCLPLLTALDAQGFTLALPLVRDDALLDFMTWRPGQTLRAGRHDIPCPVDGVIVEPSVLLTPLLAFDAHGFRLGYGAGNYDRALAALRSCGRATAIGLAFDFQETASVPADVYDQRLDWVLTPSGPRRFGE
jgi:5-formyltetrahydrofolate cyclo-ligase